MRAWRRFLVRARRGLGYGVTLLLAALVGPRRRFLQEALALARELPERLEQPLPAALQTLTPQARSSDLSADTMRQIVDAITALGAGRPLGICLRRSLLRYHFLRRAGLPLVIHFGARRQGEGIAGHAWLSLAGQPYHERPEHYQGFTVMWSFPETISAGGSWQRFRQGDGEQNGKD